MNEILEELQKRYQEARNEEYGIAIDISLVQQGIDVTKVAKRDLDQIRRLNYKIEQIKSKENQKHLEIQQEAIIEINEVHNELIKINQVIRKAQGIKDGYTAGAESEPDNSEASKYDSPPVQEH